jgi:hypothetical protein
MSVTGRRWRNFALSRDRSTHHGERQERRDYPRQGANLKVRALARRIIRARVESRSRLYGPVLLKAMFRNRADLVSVQTERLKDSQMWQQF